MSDPEAEAAAVLDEMHQAIRTARFDDLEIYSAKLETIFSGFQLLDSSALARLRRALGELIVDGVDTTVPLFHALLAEPDIQNGDYNIHWLEKWLARQLG
jgi:biotin carboxylase